MEFRLQAADFVAERFRLKAELHAELHAKSMLIPSFFFILY